MTASRLAALALVVAAVACAQPPGRAPRKVAFLVGVNRYDHGFDDLKYPERDATELGKVLAAGGFEVVVLTGSAAGKDRATKKNVEARLAALLDGGGDADKKVRKGDVVLVAFAGHGQQHTDPKTDRDAPYFVPADGFRDRPGTQVAIGPLVDDVLAPFAATNLVLIDACRDVANPNRGRGVEGADLSLKGKTAVLFSCSRGERSFESDELKHGVFTHAVLTGLRGGAVTWSALTTHVEEELASEAYKKYLPADLTQTPVATRGQLPRTVLFAAKAGPPGGETEMRPGEKAEAFEYVIEGEKKTGKRRVLAVDLGGGVSMKFVRVAAGRFTMGSPAGEKDREEDEAAHEVTLTKDFYLGMYEVTQAEYQAVVGTNPSSFKGDRLPVEKVSWDDATAFCAALSEKAGRRVELPSEAQWEYACRAGTGTPFHFGSKLNGDLANCDGGYPYGTDVKGASREKTAAVGSYPANGWGLHDLHGNVWEWCRDYHGAYDKVGVRDPLQLTKQSEDRRVLRGGSWFYIARFSRAAYRVRDAPVFRGSTVGFRVCLPLD